MVAALAATGTFGSERQAHPLLIFEFPDGERGGVGKVSGSGPLVGSDPLPLLQQCGLHRPQPFSKVTHRYFVYGRASGRDQKIVTCFMKATSQPFNVGYGKIGESIAIPMILDAKPFEKYSRNPQ
jgi:hypothetical protein